MTVSPAQCLALRAWAAFCLLFGFACGGPPPFRLNPGEEPPRFRVTCVETSRNCRKLAGEVCGGEYRVQEALANRPEQIEVQGGAVSSTGPTMGIVGWKGELIIICGRDLAPLHLSRDTSGAEVSPDTALSADVAPPPAPAAAPPAAAALLCVPGSTQACLGPGACSGAQACRADGQGYQACDCGLSTAAPPSASAVAAPLPAATAPL